MTLKPGLRIVLIVVACGVGLTSLTATVVSAVSAYSERSLNFPKLEEAPAHDLTVVLAGGRGRIRQALDLVAKGRSQKLLIIGAGAGITLNNIIPDQYWPAGMSRELVSVENESGSTLENVLKIRELVVSQHLRTVTVVTSNYHAIRTQTLLERMLPRWTKTNVVGVMSDNFQRDNFWKNPVALQIAFFEVLKFAWYWAMVPQIL